MLARQGSCKYQCTNRLVLFVAVKIASRQYVFAMPDPENEGRINMVCPGVSVPNLGIFTLWFLAVSTCRLPDDTGSAVRVGGPQSYPHVGVVIGVALPPF